MSLVFPDAMADLRSFLRAHPLLAGLSGPRVFFRIPTPAPTVAPFIRLYQAGGGPLASETPTDQLRVAHEVWGLQFSDYTLVRQTVQALKTLYQQGSDVLMGAGTVLQDARVTSSVDAPDSDSGWPRLVVDALLTVTLP
ncbi:MAG: hypothetical protein JWO62_2637 [Acidimicrobiaceae bacterium]|jgi:hypothetical protein|nr:hypothetical protein [Acidimicrobiaceae bacterium]